MNIFTYIYILYIYYHILYILFRIDLSKEIDFTKSKDSKECIVCHYWYFHHRFKFQKSAYNDCYEILIISLEINNIAIIIVKGVDYRCIIHDINKSDTIHLLENYVLDDCGYI